MLCAQGPSGRPSNRRGRVGGYAKPLQPYEVPPTARQAAALFGPSILPASGSCTNLRLSLETWFALDLLQARMRLAMRAEVAPQSGASRSAVSTLYGQSKAKPATPPTNPPANNKTAGAPTVHVRCS